MEDAWSNIVFISRYQNLTWDEKFSSCLHITVELRIMGRVPEPPTINKITGAMTGVGRPPALQAR